MKPRIFFLRNEGSPKRSKFLQSSLKNIVVNINAVTGIECGVHGAVSDYIAILSTTELATCNAQHASLNGLHPQHL